MVRRHAPACLALAVASACSSYTSADRATPPTNDAGTPAMDASTPPPPPDAGTTGCNACAVELVASGMPQIFGIVADESFIYAGTSASPGNVYRVPKAANSTAAPLGDGTALRLDSPNALTLHGDDVYIAAQNGTFRVSKTGSVVGLLDPTPANAIVVDDAFIYTCRFELSMPGKILQIPMGGGSPTAIATNSDGCETLALAGGFLFYGGSDSLGRVAPVQLAAGEMHHYASRRIAANGGQVFSLAFSDAAVRFSSLDPAGPFGTVATNPNNASSEVGDIAADATHVYWTVGIANGSVYRAPRAGGTPELIADKMAVPSGIVVDDKAVYWGERDAGRLWMRRK